MGKKSVTIKINNPALSLTSSIHLIEGKHSHLSDEEKLRFPIKSIDNNQPIFELEENTEYFVSLVIVDKNGEKYKVSVENTVKSGHPKKENTLDKGMDMWPFDIKV